MTTIRANIYESDPLLTFVETVAADDECTDYYELPADIVHAAIAAEKAFNEATKAVTDYIAEHKLRKIDPEKTA